MVYPKQADVCYGKCGKPMARLASGRRAQCIDCRRKKRWRLKYGLSVEALDALVIESQGRCTICDIPTHDLMLDHCHATKKLRGLICRYCNYLLGVAKDDPVILRKAALYLEAGSVRPQK